MSDKTKPAAVALIRGLISFNEELKKLYPPPGQPTSDEGKAMLERMKAERVERNKDIADLIDERGRQAADAALYVREDELRMAVP